MSIYNQKKPNMMMFKISLAIVCVIGLATVHARFLNLDWTRRSDQVNQEPNENSVFKPRELGIIGNSMNHLNWGWTARFKLEPVA